MISREFTSLIRSHKVMKARWSEAELKPHRVGEPTSKASRKLRTSPVPRRSELFRELWRASDADVFRDNEARV